MKGFEGDRRFLGLNPRRGAALMYRLKVDAKDVKWTIRDSSGSVIRELAGDDLKDAHKAGLNIVAWDLRVQPLKSLRSQTQQGGGAGGGFGGAGNNGPFVVLGTYLAALSVDGKDNEAVKVMVVGDPAITITETDRKTWFDAAMTLRRMHAQANDAADAVNEAWNQFQAIQQQTRNQTVPPNLKTQVEVTQEELEGMRRRLGLGGGGGGFAVANENLRGRIAQVKGAIMASTSLPTDVQVRQTKELEAALPKLVADANAAAGKVPALARDLITNNVLFAPLKPQ